MPIIQNNLLLSPVSLVAVNNYLANPSHALLISGQIGSGKSLLARGIATELLGLSSDAELDKYPYFLQLSVPADKTEITIEQIRTATASTRLKVASPKAITNIIFVEDAHLLSTEAQNALLKDLEEPSAGIVYILTSSSERGVLPTISSRAQRIKLHPISLTTAEEYFGNEYDAQAIKSAWTLSRGAVGLMKQLLDSGSQHQLKEAVEQVKNMLNMPAYERLILSERASTDKESMTMLLLAAERVVAALHRNAISKKNIALAKKLLTKRKELQKLQTQLLANANRRLIAIRLALIL